MPNVTIYLPDDLAASVKGAGISVSPVCQRALEQEVKRMKATTIEDKEIAKAAQRLVAAESDAVTEARADGRGWGREWALDRASPQELRKMQALTREPGMWLDNRMRRYVGEGISRHDEAPYESIRQYLEDSGFSLDGYAEDAVEAWWGAFEDEALETYEKVQEAMRNAKVPTEGRADAR